MALISMSVFDTVENKRSELTRRTLQSLLDTVDFTKHRLFICDNGSCEETHGVYADFLADFGNTYCFEIDTDLPYNSPVIIFNGENLGTAGAINKAWKQRNPGEHVIKIDNDVVIHSAGWVDELEAAIERDPKIGIIGLKRKDIWQHPAADPDWRTELHMLPHEAGQRWICVEKSRDVIGTCTMFNSALLDVCGYSRQPGKYGYEDCLFCIRGIKAGFYNCFLNHIEIDHIDPGGTVYDGWKRDSSGKDTAEFQRIAWAINAGTEPVYWPG